MGAGRQGLGGVAFVGDEGEERHPVLAGGSRRFEGGFRTGTEIPEDHVGVVLGEGGGGVLAGGRLPHDRDFRLAREEGGEAAPGERVVAHEEDPEPSAPAPAAAGILGEGLHPERPA